MMVEMIPMQLVAQHHLVFPNFQSLSSITCVVVVVVVVHQEFLCWCPGACLVQVQATTSSTATRQEENGWIVKYGGWAALAWANHTRT